MKSIDLVYFNAGGGHRAAALALEEAIREQRRPWNVRLVNLVDVLDPRAAFRRVTGFAPEAFYNTRLARGWTLGLAQELKLLQALIRLGHSRMLPPLRRHWRASAPDLAVSLVPNFNRALYTSLVTTLPGVPFVTVLTDLADHPPHFWIESGQRQQLVCGTMRAVAQARAAGYSTAEISLTSGMILRPAFHRPMTNDRGAERRGLGLEPERPTGIVLFGGHGSTDMLRIARQLPHVQLVFLCGHNAALAERLRASPAGAPRAVVGFTNEVWRYLHLGDFFIGKPGPGCLSEALQMGLPVITFENPWTMPQERYNTVWVRERGVGLIVPSVRALAPAVADVIRRLPEFRSRVARIRNRAVYEVLDVFAELLERKSSARMSA
jgi:hypothetical protein